MVAGDSLWGDRIEITDRDGWRKEFPLEKALLYLGSDARNDVVLDPQRGGGVMPRHMQLIALRSSGRALPPGGTGGAGYRAINLSDQDVALGEAREYSGEVGERVLAPRAAVDIGDGDVLHVGDFYLVFRLGSAVARTAAPEAAQPEAYSGLPAAFERREPESARAEYPSAQVLGTVIQPAAVAPRPTPRAPHPEGTRMAEQVGVEDRSAHMSLRLSLPRTRVEPEFPLEGAVILRNLGSEQGVQFRLEVEGLPRDWYQIGVGPILFPNVEKAVPLRLQHPRGPGLAAGRHEIQIRVSAPDAYPGEEVRVTHDIDIVPYYHHTLALTVLD